jgi:cell division protein FtsB
MKLESTSARFFRRLFVGMLLLGALGVMALNVLHPGRAQRLSRLRTSQAHLEAMMVEANAKNDRLSSDLQRLEQGAEGWQSLARKEYGMLLPGEVIYRFPAPPH